MAPAVGNLNTDGLGSAKSSKIVLFDVTKNELYKTNDTLKNLQRKLKSNWKIQTNGIGNLGDEGPSTISLESLMQSRIFVLAGPREKFTENEMNHLKKYLENGGSILVMLGEGGEKRFNTNINFFLEDYGIMINNDSVVRTNYHKYFHPKECLISNGVLNRAISESAGKTFEFASIEEGNNTQALSFVYPHGASLNVAKPAIPVLSTGSISFPLNRPICAFFTHKGNGGKLAVLGSGAMLSDQYLDKEDNNRVKDVIFDFLTSDNFKLNEIDADDPEVSDYNMIPDTCRLSNSLRVCLQESDEVPHDHTRLFDTQHLFSVSTELVPSAINSFEQLGVKHEALRLITPQFETPLPPLQPSVFPPSFRELSNPQLELFDLDEAFSSEKSRLAQISNKCTDEDIDYYVREAAGILGIIPNILQVGETGASSSSSIHGSENNLAKGILEHLMAHIFEFKKLNQMVDHVLFNGQDDENY